jgi:hypothetical protein
LSFFFSIIHINYSYSSEKDIYIVVSVDDDDDETAGKHGQLVKEKHKNNIIQRKKRMISS